MSVLKTYRRPNNVWWWRKAAYRSFVLRELSAFFIFAYALVLLQGLYYMTRGEKDYEQWRIALSHPASLTFHAVVLIFVVIHSVTWFQVAPKTMPTLRWHGVPVPQARITLAGLTLACVGNVAVLLIAAFWGGWQ